MKLLTTIPPRRDGNVVFTTAQGARLVFAPDASGSLVCDVADEALVVALLTRNEFEPADEADYESAEALLGAAESAAAKPAQADDEDDEDDEDDVPDSASVDIDVPLPAPVEKKATPKPKPPPTGRRR